MRLVLLLWACAQPVAPQATATPQKEPPRLVVQLDRDLATSELKAGDRFTARVITAGVREDARVIGVVSQSERGDEGRDPVLRLHVKWLQRGACRVPINAKITSAEVKDVSPPPEDRWRSAAIDGAVLGGLMWWTPGVVGGFGLGFAGGAIKEAHNQKVDTFLPQGALLTLKLERPVPSCQRASRETPSRRPM